MRSRGWLAHACGVDVPKCSQPLFSMAQVCVHTLSGQRWRFECPSGSTFKDLKSHIKRSLHIAKRMQHLLVDGSRVMPHEMLDRYATDNAFGVTLVVAVAVCGFCETSGVPLKRCSGCDDVYYCSASCQRNDWRDHKLICRNLPAPGRDESTR